MIFFVKNSFVHRGGGEVSSENVVVQPLPIILETKESSDWKESTLFAGRQVTPSIKQSDYKVYVRETNGKSDIKIVRPIFRWDVVLKGIPKGREQDAIDEVMKKDLGLIAGNELIWDDTRGKLEGTREDYESNKPLTIGDLGEQKAFFESLLDDTDLTLSELNSINYSKIEKILRQSFSANYQKDDAFINNRNDLIIAIDKVIAEYHKRLRQGDPNFKNHPRFDQFINYKENITNSLISDGKDFIDSVDKLSLPELLDTYKKAGIDDGKRYTLIQKIVDKHITGKGNSLAFGLDGKIIITTLNEKQQQVEAKDTDSTNIINTVSQSDLKSDVLRNIISDSGIDISKENPDYSTLIPKILDKYEIKDESGGVFVFHDIFRRKDELKSLIGKKIDKADSKTQRDLQFVLDYIDNQNSYPKEFILKASEMSNLRKSGYDPTTVDGAARIEKAIKSGNAISTILNDIKSANGGLVGAAILIGTIIGLFMKGKWRTAALWSLGIQILGPAAEQLAHKWGLAEYILKDLNLQKTGESSGLVAGLENPFKSVDVTIKNIPKKYEEVYGDMYEKNTSGDADKMLFPQDYAQIFSCLVQKQDVRQMKLDDVKNKLANGDNPKDILGDANIPKKYIKGILQSKGKDKIIDDADRNISDADMKLFLELLVSQAEPLDKTLGDAFVKGQETPTKYLDNKVYGIENTAISAEMDKISFSSPARPKLDEIVGRTKEVLSVDNAIATGTDLIGDNTKRKEQIQGIITELENLKATDPSISTNIDTIIKQYKNVLELLNLDSKIVDYKAKAFKGGDLFPGMEYIKDAANVGISGISAVVGYAKIGQGITLDKLQKLDPSEIDTLVAEGKTLLTQSGVSELQKNEINATILKLKEKKLTLLRSIDRLDPTLNNGKKMSAETQKVFADLLESNQKEYTKKLNGIDLKKIPAQKSIGEYSSIFAQNYEGMIFLQSILDIDDNTLGTEGKKMKVDAKAEMDKYNDARNGFEANLKAYISGKQTELVDINNALPSATIDTIKTSLTEFQKIKTEFIKEGIVVNSLNTLGQKFGIDALQTSENSIKDFEDYYKKSLGTTIDLGSSVFKTKLDEVETAISNRITELIEIQPQPVLPTDISNQQELDTFINEAEVYNKNISEFSSIKTSLVKTKLDILKGKIGELETMFVNGLVISLAANGNYIDLNADLTNNSKLADKWKTIKTKLGFEGKKFEEAYEKKSEELNKIQFMEGLSKITISDAPDEVGKFFNELLVKHPVLVTHLEIIVNNQSSKSVKDLLDYLDFAKKNENLLLKNDPSNTSIITRIKDIDFTINQITGFLHGDILKTQFNGLVKMTSETLSKYFTEPN